MEQQIMEVVTGATTVGLVALMAGNVILSVIAAIAKKEFSFVNVGDFVLSRVLPLIAYIVVAILGTISGEMQALAVASYAGLVALYGTGIVRAIKSLTGVNIPNVFSEKR